MCIRDSVYRVPNEDVFSQVNTVQKMAQKRALVAATMLAVNASEYYTQDLEDLTIEGSFTVSKKPDPTNGDSSKGPQWESVPEPTPVKPEPAEPFEGIPEDHVQLMSALGPLEYYNHGKHALNTINKIEGSKYNSWPQANPQFYADALETLTAYANEQKALEAQAVVSETAGKMAL